MVNEPAFPPIAQRKPDCRSKSPLACFLAPWSHELVIQPVVLNTYSGGSYRRPCRTMPPFAVVPRYFYRARYSHPRSQHTHKVPLPSPHCPVDSLSKPSDTFPLLLLSCIFHLPKFVHPQHELLRHYSC